MIVTLCLFFFAVVTILQWRGRQRHDRKVIDQIPGPIDWPFIGHYKLFVTEGHEFLRTILDTCKQYGKHGIVRLWIIEHPIILLTKAHTVEVLLNSAKHITKSREYNFLHPWLGTGLLTSTGEKWHTRRKVLTPTFHFKILEDFQHVFNEQSRILVRKLDKMVGQKEPFNVFPFITLCTLDVICDTAMGKNVNAQSQSDSYYVKCVYRIGTIIQARMKTPWWMNDRIFRLYRQGRAHDHYIKVLKNFTREVIEERSAELDKQLASHSGKISMDDLQTDKPFLIGKQKRLAFLDMLLVAAKGGAQLNHEDIQEEVDTFMFEGHDTTAATTNWAVYLLGANPEVQEKAQAEVDYIFGDDDRDATTDDVKKMKYLTRCVKETLRLFATVPMFGREVEEDCTVGEFTIPKGSTAVVMTAVLHRDPKYFPDPDVFDPDRWLPENMENRHPYSFVPFSAGLRNCIGQKFAMNEEKVILSHILRNFTIKSHQTTEDLRPAGELIQRPENGIMITLERRQRADGSE